MKDKKPFQILEVSSNETIKEFLDFPSRLYLKENNWIRPLDQDVAKVFDPSQNKKFRKGDAKAIEFRQYERFENQQAKRKNNETGHDADDNREDEHPSKAVPDGFFLQPVLDKREPKPNASGEE